MTASSGSRLAALTALGQSIWLDYLSRDLLRSGALERLIEEHHVTGVTSNPTIFEHAMTTTDAYDAQLRSLGAADVGEAFVELAATDVRAACDLFEPLWRRSAGADGYVSWEVDPGLAYDTATTVKEARRLVALVRRPNLLVKVPATGPGIRAVEECVARGISVNVTLIFSLQRYVEVLQAHLRGIARLLDRGGDPSGIYSVASVFVSRLDTAADARLDALGTAEAASLRGRLGLATARLAYREYRAEWERPFARALRDVGVMPQRPLWASTATKDPAYSDTMYVDELIGAETITTLTEPTLRAFADHGVAAPTLERELEEAEATVERLTHLGIYDEVVDELEGDGVRRFAASYRGTLEALTHRQRALRPAA